MVRILLAGTLFLISACATTTKDTPVQTRDFTVRLDEIALSADNVGRTRPYEVFMVIKRDIPEILIKIVTVSATFDGGTRNLSAFMVVERGIRRNDTPGGYAWAELYRNFDSNWNILSEQNYRPEPSLPLARLTPGLYRIRFIPAERYAEKVMLNYRIDLPIAFYAARPDEAEINAQLTL